MATQYLPNEGIAAPSKRIAASQFYIWQSNKKSGQEGKAKGKEYPWPCLANSHPHQHKNSTSNGAAYTQCYRFSQSKHSAQLHPILLDSRMFFVLVGLRGRLHLIILHTKDFRSNNINFSYIALL